MNEAMKKWELMGIRNNNNAASVEIGKAKDNDSQKATIAIISLLLSITLFLCLSDIIILPIIIVTISTLIYCWNYKAIGISILSSLQCMAPILGLLYTLIYPLLYLVLGWLPTPFSGVSKESVISSTKYCIIFILILELLGTIFPPKRREKIQLGLELNKMSCTIGMILFDVLFLFFYIEYIRKVNELGGIRLIVSTGVARAEVLETLRTIPRLAYLKYACITYSVYSIISILNLRRDLRRAESIRVALIASFWILDLTLGNRREVLYLIFGLLLYLSVRKHEDIKSGFQVKILFSIITILILFMYISVRRDIGFKDSETRIRNAFGEFIYPMITLYYYWGRGIVSKLGVTYLQSLAVIIPRQLWMGKPISLSQQFMIDYGTKMGYAYTPFTESFVNYNVVGCIIVPLFVFLIIHILENRSSRYKGLYLCVFMEMANFFRGESSSFILEAIIMFITFYLIETVNTFTNDNYKGGARRES